MTASSIGAAVCSRSRPAQLARALRSLQAQHLPLEEILVVDNNPGDGRTRQAAAEAPGVRYCAEPVPGLNFARNRALRELQTPLIAVLDDDAVADRRWAEQFAETFAQHPSVGVCTGRVEPLALETEAQRLFEVNGGFSRGLTAVHLPADARRPLHGRPAPLIAWAVSVGNGASFALRRETALAVGGFDEALDLGPALPGGGDLDMFWRMLCAGHELRYAPQAVAWHEHRQDLAQLAAQLAGHQRALVAFLCKSAVASPGWARLEASGFLAWRLLKPGARLLGRLAGRDPLPAPLLWRMWAHAWAGLVSYPLGRRIASRRRRAGAAAAWGCA
jgi:GT2 family glycosyltransferase